MRLSSACHGSDHVKTLNANNRDELWYRYSVSDTDSFVRRTGISRRRILRLGPTTSLSKVLCVRCSLSCSCFCFFFLSLSVCVFVFCLSFYGVFCFCSLFVAWFWHYVRGPWRISDSVLLNARRVWIFNKPSASSPARLAPALPPPHFTYNNHKKKLPATIANIPGTMLTKLPDRG